MSAKISIAHRLYTGEISYDFVKQRRIWYLVSAGLLLMSILAIAFKGLSLGIEFRGGVDFTVPMPVVAGTTDEMRRAVLNAGVEGLEDVNVTSIGQDTIRIETSPLGDAEVVQVRTAISEAAGVPSTDVNYSRIGPSWGQQITTQALTALGVFLVLVMLLIWVYFRDFKMSISAILALLHDLTITIGVYALVGFTVTPATLIGVLTILGYSLYDTVVVFDKIRENVRDLFHTKQTYSDCANLAVNQVLVRSLNTTVIGVLPVAALLFTGSFVLGSGPLEDLGLALFVGMIIGAYSSIFIATPLLAQMREVEPEMREHRARLERRAARSARRPGAVVSVPLGTEAVGNGVEPVGLAVSIDEEAPVVDQLGWVDADQVTSITRTQPSRQSRSQRKK